MCIPPVNTGMATGNHDLLHIHALDEQFSDGSAIAIDGDPAKTDRPSFDHPAKMIAGSSGPFWLSPFPTQFWRIDAGQPDLLTSVGRAGVAVIAAADDDGFQGSSRNPKHQQQGS